ncbi:NADH-quinone oxidoreductase subunit M [Kineosporiaceae bacterium SCSIO 59966]|nr:NADH-quinone oxidoreductase subunit M [Kineosporiaceae bacterium SCSIO 59966]
MSSGFPWLTTAGLIPLVGALVLWLLPASARRLARPLALGVSLLTLLVVVAMALTFDVAAAGTHQFTETYPWIPQLGVSYALGIDGIGLTMIALAAVLTPVVVLAGWHDAGTDPARTRTFFALLLLVETMMIGVFAARDVFLFYVLFEAMLIPVYFLIGMFGGPQRRYAAVKFLLYSLLGGLLMLVAVIALYLSGPRGPEGFLVENLVGLDHGETAGRLMFLGFFIAFAIKAPMWPVHTWLPDAAGQAPPGTSVLLVGVLDKVGTFGMLTLLLPLFPQESRWAAPAIAVLAVISILYGALVAIGQTDMMRLIAYTSVSHFGFIVLGIFAMTSTAQNGAALYMVNHGFTTAALFLIMGMLVARRGTARIADYGGVQRVAPVIAGTFLVAGLSSLALPGLSSFVSEFLVLAGTYARWQWAAVVAALGVILAAVYILLPYQRMFTGPATEPVKALPDMRAREAWVVAPLLAIIVALGVYPKPVLDVLDPAVQRTMQEVGVTDPEPTVPGAATAGRDDQ